MSKAYWVVRVDIADMDVYKGYVAAGTGIVQQYGGKFLARAGRYQCLEGSSRSRNIVIEFPSYQAALDCWNDETYQRARQIRLPVSTIDLIVLDGEAGR